MELLADLIPIKESRATDRRERARSVYAGRALRRSVALSMTQALDRTAADHGSIEPAAAALWL